MVSRSGGALIDALASAFLFSIVLAFTRKIAWVWWSVAAFLGVWYLQFTADILAGHMLLAMAAAVAVAVSTELIVLTIVVGVITVVGSRTCNINEL